MKTCADKFCLVIVMMLTAAVCATYITAQTQDSQPSRFYQSDGLVGHEHITNTISNKSQSKKRMSDLGQTVKALKSKRVESKNGDKLGSISDLVIDARSGRVAYVVVSSGGVAGIGKHDKLVPPTVVSTATTKRDVVSLDLTQGRWNNAPKFNRKEVATFDAASEARKIDQFYQQPSTSTLQPTGRTDRRMQLASEFIGKMIINKQNQPVGKISDLLVDISHAGTKSAFVIFKPNSILTEANSKKSRDNLYTVSARFLHPSKNQDELLLDIDSQHVQQPPRLTQEIWAASGTGEATIYSYR